MRVRTKCCSVHFFFSFLLCSCDYRCSSAFRNHHMWILQYDFLIVRTYFFNLMNISKLRSMCQQMNFCLYCCGNFWITCNTPSESKVERNIPAKTAGWWWCLTMGAILTSFIHAQTKTFHIAHVTCFMLSPHLKQKESNYLCNNSHELTMAPVCVCLQ